MEKAELYKDHVIMLSDRPEFGKYTAYPADTPDNVIPCYQLYHDDLDALYSAIDSTVEDN